MNIFGLNEEEIKSRINFRADNYEKIKEMIRERNCVHEREEDLVKLYGIDLAGVRAPELPDPDEAVSVIALTENMVRDLGIDLQEVKELAQENMLRRNPARVRPLMDVLNGMIGMEDAESSQEESPGIVMCSNTSGIMGAATMFYPGIEEKIKAVIGSDFYILPSSVHEVLAVPKTGMDLEDLRNMVTTINEAEVSPKEQLSNNVYEFSGGRLRIALTEKERNNGKTSINEVKNIAGQRRGSARANRPGRGSSL